MKTQRRTIGLVVLSIFILVVGMACGLVVGSALPTGTAQSAAQGSNAGSNATLDQTLIDQAWKIIQDNYVDRPAIQSKTLTYGAISGMVSALGDTGHSRFLSPDMVTQENIQTQGQFEGIGAEVEMRNGQVTIVAPIDGSPAQKAGLQPGDVIVKVDGVDMTGMSLNDVVSKVLGPAGTQVTLTILQAKNSELRDVTITRAKIIIVNVTWAIVPGTTIADLRIAQFSQGVSGDVAKALQQIEAQHMTGIILDLRNDPGGILNEAIKVISLFQDSGNALLVKDAKGTITAVPVERGVKATTLPVVVLINEGTASASEITAGALQDAGRATLLGATTFGTGTVMNEFKLSDGSVMLLATEEWLTPKGRVIWHKGIEPDQAVKLPDNATLVIPEAEKSMTAEQVQSSGDTQLLQALKDLSGN